MPKKSAIVVGSGIAGSGIAALLAHSGEYEVDLYEKNGIAGGRFASYTREGFRLDIGCHMIANCEKGTMGKILTLLGRPDAVEWVHLKGGAYLFNYKGTEFVFPEEIHKMGFSREEIERIMRFYTETLSIPDDELEEYEKVNMLDQIRKYIQDDRARSLFGCFAGLYFVIEDFETPVAEWVHCSRQMTINRSTGYPVGGTGAIPQAYLRIAEEHGARVHMATPIRRIIVENGAAKGVELRDGKVRSADIVISNVGLKPTVHRLVGRDRYSQSFLDRVDRYEYSFPCGALKVALDEPIVEKPGLLLYIGTDDLLANKEKIAAGMIPEAMDVLMIPIISNVDPSSCPPGRQLLIAGTGSGMATSQEDRRRWKQAYLNTLERIFPGISQHILWAVYTSPSDIDRLFGEEGNVIGIAQKVGQVGKDRPPIQDPEIRGLYHCSADSGMHGIGGELAADSVLRLYEMLLG